ncbi:unnamed protein product [Rangifer tarandus platyrhynchus]|uniref:Uncharacterized protein n=2 Tax=Rangifer tarandus platyrhynchus TaxID=3082113 RepID=A0AC59YFR8_RANTA|nr:unnamed protein product [Rangifer tarandus platyrhynchus]
MGLRIYMSGLPWWISDEESASQGRRRGFDPSSRKISHALEQLKPVCHNLFSRAWEPPLLKPADPRARAPQKPPQREALTWRAATTRRQQREAHTAAESQRSHQRGKAMISKRYMTDWTC